MPDPTKANSGHKPDLNDMLDGLAMLRTVFLRAGLQSPTALTLGSHEDGMRFLSAMRQATLWVVHPGDPSLGRPTELADGSIWMEVEAMGIKVRWPANRRATPDVSWSYV